VYLHLIIGYCENLSRPYYLSTPPAYFVFPRLLAQSNYRLVICIEIRRSNFLPLFQSLKHYPMSVDSEFVYICIHFSLLVIFSVFLFSANHTSSARWLRYILQLADLLSYTGLPYLPGRTDAVDDRLEASDGQRSRDTNNHC